MKNRGWLCVVFCGLLAIPSLAQARLDLSPSWINFGLVEIGQRRTQMVRVTNSSSTPVRINTVFMWGHQDFRMTNWCFSTLSPYQSCTIYIDYAPTQEGHESTRLEINTTDGYYSETIEGTGVKR